MPGIWFQLKLTLSDLSLCTARVHLLMPSYLLSSNCSQQERSIQCRHLEEPAVCVHHIISHSPVGQAPTALGNGLSVNLSSHQSWHGERTVGTVWVSPLSLFPFFPSPFSLLPQPLSLSHLAPPIYFLVYERTIINLKWKCSQTNGALLLAWACLHANSLSDRLHFCLTMAFRKSALSIAGVCQPAR